MLTRAEMLAIIAGGGSVSWNGLILSLAAHVPTDQEIADVAAARAAAAPATQGDIDTAIDAAIADLELAPFADSTALVKGSGDATKGIRFEVDGLTAGATRVITPPDANTTLPVASQVITLTGPTAARTATLPDANFTAARTDAGQTFTGTQAFAGITGTTGEFTGAVTAGGAIVARAGGSAVSLGGTSILYVQSTSSYGGLSFGAPSGQNTFFEFLEGTTKKGSLEWDAAGILYAKTNGSFNVTTIASAAILTVTSGGALTVASLNLGGATLLDVLYASAALDFGSIVAGASADLTITVAGAVTGDTVELGRPAAEEGGLVTTAIVTGADTVTVRAKNTNLVAAVDQASLTYKATVFRI